MFKINDQLIIDLTSFVDIESLYKLKPYIEYGLAKHHDKTVPSQYIGEIFLEPGIGFFDISQNQKDNLLREYPYLNELDGDEMIYWLRYHLDIKYGQKHLHIISAKDWLTKHDPTQCDVNLVTDTFKPFLDWVEEQNIFSTYGRVNAFINEPGVKTPIHHDPPFLDKSPRDNFIWINLSNRKKFFIYDHINQQKTYIGSPICVFDNHNYHGSEASELASWSLRVDGTFSKEFLERANLVDHFG